MSFTPDSTDAIAPKVKLAAEDYTLGMNFTRLLANSGETIASVVGSVTYAPNDGSLTISGAVPNAAPFNDDSQPPVPVAIGKGILVEIAGGTPPTANQIAAGPPYASPLVLINGVVYTQYILSVLFLTSGGNKRGGRCVLLVPYA